MGRARRKAVRRRGGARLQRHHGDPGGGGKTLHRRRLRDFAGIAGGELPGRVRLAAQRSRQTVRAYLLHGAVEHVGKPGALDQWRLRRAWLSDWRADHRTPLRRSRRAGHGQGIRGPARRTEAVARAAEEVTPTVPSCADQSPVSDDVRTRTLFSYFDAFSLREPNTLRSKTL